MLKQGTTDELNANVRECLLNKKKKQQQKTPTKTKTTHHPSKTCQVTQTRPQGEELKIGTIVNRQHGQLLRLVEKKAHMKQRKKVNGYRGLKFERAWGLFQ